MWPRSESKEIEAPARWSALQGLRAPS
jgi:hypothetical protein